MLNWLKNRPVFVFVGLFTFQIILFYILYYNPVVQDKLFTPLIITYAKLSSHLLNSFGYHTFVAGDIISSSQFSVEIKKGCDAAEPMALLIAGILAFPISFKKKLAGLVPGLAVLFLLNLIRIVTLFITGVHKPLLFDMMHLEIWQAIFIIIAITIWFFWLRWSLHKPTNR